MSNIVKFNEAANQAKGEIILYQPDETIRLEVRLENETFWLNRPQMAVLFDRDVKTIGKHINNALKEELKGFSVVANFATTAADGKTYNMAYYSLDMIISVGYRVKSQRGIEFRQWANPILKEYLLKGYVFNQQMNTIEKFAIETGRRVAELENEVAKLKLYNETILSDFNDINEDTRMQLELISEQLAELQVKNKWIDKPRNPIGFVQSKNDN